MATNLASLNNPTGATPSTQNLFNEIIVEAQYTAQENSIMRPLVNMFPVANAVGNVVQIPRFTAFTAQAGAEGTDLIGTAAEQSLSTTVQTITMAEVAAMSVLTDDAVETMPNYNLAAEIGRILGAEMAEKFDEDAMGKFAAFTTNTLDTTANGLRADDIFKAAGMIRSQKATGQLVGVFHPAAVYQLKAQLASAGAAELGALSNVGNSALSSGLVGTIAGVTIFESTLAGTTGAVFALDALGGAMKRDVRLETERDASRRATEIVGSAVWGFEAVREENGVAITTVESIV
jgi:hypothetical protein